MKLSQLIPGQTGIIKEFTDLEMSVKLMEMGCLPGESIVVERLAPLGDPMAITVSGYQLTLRKKEASTIIMRFKNCISWQPQFRKIYTF
ncbi:MAG TPA: ferrous iron transport protein A [Daejeonella sp.]|nr:ferrous iron transport protein A [Daejeonella sp.]